MMRVVASAAMVFLVFCGTAVNEDWWAATSPEEDAVPVAGENPSSVRILLKGPFTRPLEHQQRLSDLNVAPGLVELYPMPLVMPDPGVEYFIAEAIPGPNRTYRMPVIGLDRGERLVPRGGFELPRVAPGTADSAIPED